MKINLATIGSAASALAAILADFPHLEAEIEALFSKISTPAQKVADAVDVAETGLAAVAGVSTGGQLNSVTKIAADVAAGAQVVETVAAELTGQPAASGQ